MQKFMKAMLGWFNLDFWGTALSTVAAWLLHAVTPVAPFLLLATTLTVANALTGYVASVRRDGMAPGAKVLVYLVAIGAAEGFRLTFNDPVSAIMPHAVAIGICGREFVRVLRNVETGTGEGDSGIFEAIIGRFLPSGKNKDENNKKDEQ